MDKPDQFDEQRTYWVTGKALNKLADLISERTVVAGEGISTIERRDGVTIALDADWVRDKLIAGGGFVALPPIIGAGTWVLGSVDGVVQWIATESC